jgi:hypothetical protein
MPPASTARSPVLAEREYVDANANDGFEQEDDGFDWAATLIRRRPR